MLIVVEQPAPTQKKKTPVGVCSLLKNLQQAFFIAKIFNKSPR